MPAQTSRPLALRPVTQDIWQTIQAIAPVAHQSRLFGVSSVEQAAMVALKGHELGMGITAAFEYIYVINGKPTLSPRGALALIYQSGEMDGMKITEKPDACTVWMKRKNGAEYEITWTLGDAKRSGLIKSGSTWETYPANLLRWRAIGFCADVLFPDVQGGLKRSDEMGALVSDQGDIVDAEWASVPAPPVSPKPASLAPTSPTITLDTLITQYGADAVFAAAEGVVPATDEEIQQVAAKLAGAQ